MNPIIIALDNMGEDQAVDLAHELRGKVWGFKVNDLFVRHGLDVVEDLGMYGSVMLDLKLYDIPNTVKNTCRAIMDLNTRAHVPGCIQIVTVHAHGGVPMMREAVKELSGRIAAVTVLTSFDENHYRAVHETACSIPNRVATLAAFAEEAGCTYVVCSGAELFTLTGNRLKKIVPGIRPAWYQKADDQKRVMAPRQAMDAGADFLVIGRPIVEAANPVEAAELTLKEIS